MAWELIDPTGYVHRLYDGAMIGRSPGIGISVNDPKASRLHAEFRVRGDSIMVRDRDSTNGTYVNRIRLVTPCGLNPGDRITIGDTAFILRWAPEGAAVVAPRVGPVPYPAEQSNAAVANVVIQQFSAEQTKQQPEPSTALGQFMYCPSCGRKIAQTAISCPGCGATLGKAGDNVSDRDWLTTLLLCILTGVLGVHRFYTGHIGTGILQLLTGGGLGIWTIIDLITIVTGKFRDSEGRLIAKK